MNVVSLKDRFAMEAERLRKRAEALSNGKERDVALHKASLAETAAKLYATLPSRWLGDHPPMDEARTERR